MCWRGADAVFECESQEAMLCIFSGSDVAEREAASHNQVWDLLINMR